MPRLCARAPLSSTARHRHPSGGRGGGVGGEGGRGGGDGGVGRDYSGRESAAYLDYVLRQSERVGIYTHYSETHDNPRLATRGRTWSLMRNRLCGLASVSGGFG